MATHQQQKSHPVPRPWFQSGTLQSKKKKKKKFFAKVAVQNVKEKPALLFLLLWHYYHTLTSDIFTICMEVFPASNSDSSWVSYNFVQFWYYLEIGWEFHRLSIKHYRTATHFRCQSQVWVVTCATDSDQLAINQVSRTPPLGSICYSG